jgi:hypothetical protein
VNDEKEVPVEESLAPDGEGAAKKQGRQGDPVEKPQGPLCRLILQIASAAQGPAEKDGEKQRNNGG